jgi:hypothetical protein
VEIASDHLGIAGSPASRKFASLYDCYPRLALDREWRDNYARVPERLIPLTKAIYLSLALELIQRDQVSINALPVRNASRLVANRQCTHSVS